MQMAEQLAQDDAFIWYLWLAPRWGQRHQGGAQNLLDLYAEADTRDADLMRRLAQPQEAKP
jgi:hypothetical protein